ncbi:unnamed protein product [Caenorhabditis brenneri]
MKYDTQKFLRKAVRLRIGNLKIDFRIRQSSKTESHFYLIHRETKDIIPLIQEHIQSLFRRPIPSYIAVTVDEKLNELPEIEGVEASSLIGKINEVSFLERFFRTYPNQKAARIFTNKNGTLRNSSKVFNIDYLFIMNSEAMTPMILRNFKGKYLSLNNASHFKMKNLIRFFRDWISKERYANLEYLQISLKSGILRRDAIMERLQTRPWDRTARPQIFHHSAETIRRIRFVDEFYESVDCDIFLDIERVDGTLASIGIDWDNVYFCVWSESQLAMGRND